jgi:hypothetical protein
MAERPKLDLSVIGQTGLRQTSGFLYEEPLRVLRGQNGARTFREMADNDPTVGAILFAVQMLIRQVEWRVQATDESDKATRAQTFVEEVIRDISTPWSSIMSEVASMFVYGFAPLEIVWKRRGGASADPTRASEFTDGKVGVRALSLRAQTSLVNWLIDDATGDILGMVQQPISGPMVTIPTEKLLLFRTSAERNNPEGRSILRNAYRPWMFKKRIEEIEGVGVERDLAGLPVAYIPSQYFDKSADAQERATLAAWQKLVTQVRRDQQEGILIPSDRDASGNLMFDLKLLSTGGTRAFDTSRVIERYDRAIATSVLADFIFLGQQSVGSFALSSDKTALFATAVGGFLGMISDVLNRDLMPRLWRLNAMDPAIMPRIVAGDLERADLDKISGFVQRLAQSGAQMFPDRDLENHLRKLAGLPLAPEESESEAPGFDPTMWTNPPPDQR